VLASVVAVRFQQALVVVDPATGGFPTQPFTAGSLVAVGERSGARRAGRDGDPAVVVAPRVGAWLTAASDPVVTTPRIAGSEARRAKSVSRKAR